MSGGQKQLLQQENSSSPSSRRRPERPSLSCTECRRRKQKCNQGKPCTNCSRRFPQPICEYDTRVSKRPKRTGTQTSEDPTLGVTDTNGPYSHLKNAGVQDAIIQIELPTRVIKREPGSGNSPNGSWSSRSDNGSPDPWKPFTAVTNDPQNAVANKTITRAIRKIVRGQLAKANSMRTNGDSTDTALVVRAAHDLIPPSKPIGNYFDDLRHLPMAPTRLNQELVRTHLQLLSRFKVSIDGNPGPDNAFMRHWIPFTLQDPLMLHVILYTSACFLKETGHVPKTLTMAYKGTVYQMLNNSLRTEKEQCADVVVLAVSQLVLDEWYWGATSDLRAHMLGLQMIIRLRGGLQNLGMHGFLAKLILMHDVGIALTHETETEIFDQPGYEFDDPIMVPFQTSLNSPFVSGWPTFLSSLPARMHPSTAAILDDIRILIETVLGGLNDDHEHNDSHKLFSVVSWIQQRLDSLPQEISQLPERPSSREPSEDRTWSSSPARDSGSSSHSSPAEQIALPSDPMYSWIRKTALIYCRAISERQPLSIACSPSDFQYLWQYTWRNQQDASCTTIGILFWVIAAIAPASSTHAASRFIKTMLIPGLMNMAVENWHVAIDAARRALKLQRWLSGGGDEGIGVHGGEKGIEKHGFALKDTLGQLGLTVHYEEGGDDGG